MNRIPRSYWAATGATGALLLASSILTACGTAHGSDGTIRPYGTAHGTFPYCAYKVDDDGIEIGRYATTPCVVGDARSKKDRKKKARPKVVVTTTGRSSFGSGINTPKPTKKPGSTSVYKPGKKVPSKSGSGKTYHKTSRH